MSGSIASALWYACCASSGDVPSSSHASAYHCSAVGSPNATSSGGMGSTSGLGTIASARSSSGVRVSNRSRIRAAPRVEKRFTGIPAPPQEVFLLRRDLLHLGRRLGALRLRRRLLAGRAVARAMLLETLLQRVHQIDDLRALDLRSDGRDLLALDLLFDRVEDALPVVVAVLLRRELV